MSEPFAGLEDAKRLLRQGAAEAAVRLLARETQAATAVNAAHALLIDTLFRMDRRQEAETVLDGALRLPAPTADALDALAFHLRRMDRHDESNALYRQAVALAPADSQLWYNLATSERTLGHLDATVAACDRALAIDPDAVPSLLLRSEATRATTESNHVESLQARLAADTSDRGRMFTAYALGKELHDLRRYDEAFAAFSIGASTRRRRLAYDVAEDERKLARIEAAYPTVQPIPGAGDSGAGAGHIFIVGLPRSGTTLTERILSGLPNVRSNGETDNFARALVASAPQVAGDVFDRCAQAEPAAVAQRYDARARRPGFEGKIIEKLPLNYLYVGAIARALPAASIIWLRRHPLDSCFAMFRTLFGEAYPFSYDFDDLARYYAAYDRLMAHWRRTLPGRMFEVEYDELVGEPERLGPMLAAHCGLAWSAAALDITQNRTASLTASAAQVREPIHRRSAGLWRLYSRPLEPLAAALTQLGVALSDA